MLCYAPKHHIKRFFGKLRPKMKNKHVKHPDWLARLEGGEWERLCSMHNVEVNAGDVLYVSDLAVYWVSPYNYVVMVPRKAYGSLSKLTNIPDAEIMQLLYDAYDRFGVYCNIRKFYNMRFDMGDQTGCQKFHIKIGVNPKAITLLRATKKPLQH